MNNQYTNIYEEGIEIAHTIYDKSGDAYTVRGNLSPSGLISYVCFKKGCVGRINWFIPEPSVLIILDLIIFDMMTIPPLWGRIFPFLYRQPSYKGRGLGSAMLHYIITSAQAMEVVVIRGQITRSDLEATPYLLTFYRKGGFTVNDDLSFYQMLE